MSEEHYVMASISRLPATAPIKFSFNTTSNWVVGIHSLFFSSIHQYKTSEDVISLGRFYVDVHKVTPETNLSKFVGDCLKYSLNPRIYTEKYFNKFLNFEKLKDFSINFSSYKPHTFNKKDFFEVKFNLTFVAKFSKSYMYTMKEIFYVILDAADNDSNYQLFLKYNSNPRKFLKAKYLEDTMKILLKTISSLQTEFFGDQSNKLSKIFVETDILKHNNNKLIRIYDSSELLEKHSIIHEKIIYQPMKQKFETIKVDIKNDFNDDVIFADDFSHFYVILHMKRINLNLINRKRKREFPQNDSLINFEDNI